VVRVKSLCLTKHHAMKTYGEVEVWLHTFLTSALVEGEWSASRPTRFTPGERVPGIHRIRGWVGSRADLDSLARRTIPVIASAGNRIEESVS
jgi:hypothetical protein